jgi:quercetin dioxygenase-like cupin family protein
MSIDEERRRMLGVISAVAGAAAAGGTSPAAAQSAGTLPPPKRVVTGRDEAGKSVFRSVDVTPGVVNIESNPGLTFYELYATDGVPQLTGREADPMPGMLKDFPGPGGSYFRLISYPPRRPPGYKPPAGVTFDSALKELSDKVPGMGDHFERDGKQPGMHTTDTIDYGVVVRGEMTLELDDGKIVTLKQGDCIVQNGTRHRWRNALETERCLMAFVSVGAKRAKG